MLQERQAAILTTSDQIGNCTSIAYIMRYLPREVSMVRNNTGVLDVIQSQQWSLAGFLVIKVHQLEGHGWHYINKAGE